MDLNQLIGDWATKVLARLQAQSAITKASDTLNAASQAETAAKAALDKAEAQFQKTGTIDPPAAPAQAAPAAAASADAPAAAHAKSEKE